MPKQVYKNRLVPAKLLLFILYGQYSWLDRRAGGLVLARLGPLRRTVRVSSQRLRDAIRHLKEVGIFQSVEFSYGKARITVNKPLVDWEGVQSAPEASSFQFGYKASIMAVEERKSSNADQQ